MLLVTEARDLGGIELSKTDLSKATGRLSRLVKALDERLDQRIRTALSNGRRSVSLSHTVNGDDKKYHEKGRDGFTAYERYDAIKRLARIARDAGYSVDCKEDNEPVGYHDWPYDEDTSITLKISW